MSASYDINFSAPLHSLSGYVSAGTCLIQAAGSIYYMPATAANMAAQGNTVVGGVALTAGDSKSPIAVQQGGVVPAYVSGLGAGAKSYVIAHATSGALVRKTSPTTSDAIVGYCNEFGDVTLAMGILSYAVTGPQGPVGQGLTNFTVGTAQAPTRLVAGTTANATPLTISLIDEVGSELNQPANSSAEYIGTVIARKRSTGARWKGYFVTSYARVSSTPTRDVAVVIAPDAGNPSSLSGLDAAAIDIVPNGTAGNMRAVVTGLSGTQLDWVVNVTQTSIASPSAPVVASPTVTSVSPNHGAQAGGDSVSIFGTNFTSDCTDIQFGGGAAVAIAYQSPTQIDCDTPAHSGAGAVLVFVHDVVTGADSGATGNGTFSYDAGGGWTPTSSANLKLWLKPSAGFTPSLWTDQSGAGNNFAQATSSQRPTLVAGAVNGLDAIRFTSASGSRMDGPALSALITNSAYTVLIVCQPITIGASSGTSYNNTAIIGELGGYFGAYDDSTGPKAVAGNYTSADTVVKSNLVGLSNTYLHTQRHQGGNLYLSVNSNAEVSVASGATGSLAGQVFIGEGAVASFFDGYICEILVYSVDLDTQNAGDLALAKAYLKAKWGTP